LAQVGLGKAGDVGEGGHTEVDRGASCYELVELGQFRFGCGEADFQSLDFTEPAFTFGFVDAGLQVLQDLQQAIALGGVRAQQRATDACVLVDAVGSIGAATVAKGDLALFEVAEELLPFFVGWGPVLLAGW